MGTGELRMIHSRVAWIFFPVERSMTVSAPHLVAQRIFSTSSSMLLATALLPMLALILTRKLRPIIIGSSSGWLILAGMMARPRATSERTNSGVMSLGILAPNDSPGCWWDNEFVAQPSWLWGDRASCPVTGFTGRDARWPH